MGPAYSSGLAQTVSKQQNLLFPCIGRKGVDGVEEYGKRKRMRKEEGGCRMRSKEKGEKEGNLNFKLLLELLGKCIYK